MKLRSWGVIAAIGFCINAASPVSALYGVTGPQPQEPLLYLVSETCEQRTNRWKRWYRICLKECEDIAAGYALQSTTTTSNSSVYQKELNECLAACDSKNDYYKNDLC